MGSEALQPFLLGLRVSFRADGILRASIQRTSVLLAWAMGVFQTRLWRAENVFRAGVVG